MLPILIILILFVIMSVFLLVKQVLFNIHMIQLNSYNIDQVFLWYKKNIIKFVPNVVLLLLSILMYDCSLNLAIEEFYSIFSRFINVYYVIGIVVLIFVISIILFIKNILKSKAKKKLVFTKRVIRNIGVIIIFYILLSTLSYLIFNTVNFYIVYTTYYGESFDVIRMMVFDALYIVSSASFFVSIVPFVVLLTYLIIYPIENMFKKSFIDDAKKKLRENDNVNVIGLTGSFGKTSVKNFLYKMLSIKYNTCKTPESYNTPMGLTLTINNNLKNYDEMFIAEMGARRVGDIKELCGIVDPKDAIVTEVGNMHLDTFKNIENVLKTKMELVDHVVENIKRSGHGIILLNGDNELIRKYIEDKNYEDVVKEKTFFIGRNEENDFVISNINFDKDGARFNISINDNFANKVKKCTGLCDCVDGEQSIISENNINAEKLECDKNDEVINMTKEWKFATKLIGINNIVDISMAVTFAILKGVDVEEIKYAVNNLEQVKNRLEIMKVDEDNILINDAYNSNLIGAKNAIDAVASFNDYKKIIITPGIVELGDKQKEENIELSRYAKEKLDYVFVVGKTNKEYLLEGARSDSLHIDNEDTNIDNKDVLYFDKVEEAIMYARLNVADKKVVLLENDLTDNY